MDQIAKNTALWSVEKIINHAIKSDSHVEKKLSALSGKSVEIETESPAFLVTIHFDDKKVRFSGLDSRLSHSVPDVKISGKSKQLLELLINKNGLINRNISVIGDAQLLQNLYKTVQSLDVDWPYLFTPIFGHVAINEIDQFVEGGRAWASTASKRLKQNFDEYLKEEIALFPHDHSMDKFGDDVDQLKLKIDRITANADLLNQKINNIKD